MIARILLWFAEQIVTVVEGFLDGYNNGLDGVRRQWNGEVA